MTPERQRYICETHPELVFLRLNKGRPLPSKSSLEGREIRRDLVKGAGCHAIDDWLRQRLGTGAKPDDVLDACACALAARDAKDRFPAVEPELDAGNLRMEIWY
jgi:predicted RNase H-like nuclease